MKVEVHIHAVEGDVYVSNYSGDALDHVHDSDDDDCLRGHGLRGLPESNSVKPERAIGRPVVETRGAAADLGEKLQYALGEEGVERIRTRVLSSTPMDYAPGEQRGCHFHSHLHSQGLRHEHLHHHSIPDVPDDIMHQHVHSPGDLDEGPEPDPPEPDHNAAEIERSPRRKAYIHIPLYVFPSGVPASREVEIETFHAQGDN